MSVAGERADDERNEPEYVRILDPEYVRILDLPADELLEDRVIDRREVPV
jgi:hypothetical protein